MRSLWRWSQTTRHPKKGARQCESGFTLIEFVLVIVLFGIVAAVGSKMLAEGFRAYFAGRDLIDAQWQGRVALERMTRDIRAARSNADISIWSAAQLTFTRLSGASISYQLAGISLMRNTQVLADGVAGLAFSYQASDGSAAATVNDIRYITVSMNITQGGVASTLATTVHARNLL